MKLLVYSFILLAIMLRPSVSLIPMLGRPINKPEYHPTTKMALPPTKSVSRFMGAVSLASCLLFHSHPSPAFAATSGQQATTTCGENKNPTVQVIGQVRYETNWPRQSKVLNLYKFSDPKIHGLTMYLSYQDPTAMSLTGQAIKDNNNNGGARLAPGISLEDLKNEEIVFRACKKMEGLAFRERYLQVRRFYDEENQNLVYVASSNRRFTIDGTFYSRIISSTFAVPLSFK
eukprot:scaffold575_cov186-Amphora_coffeaeformis.AAC.12